MKHRNLNPDLQREAELHQAFLRFHETRYPLWLLPLFLVTFAGLNLAGCLVLGTEEATLCVYGLAALAPSIYITRKVWLRSARYKACLRAYQDAVQAIEMKCAGMDRHAPRPARLGTLRRKGLAGSLAARGLSLPLRELASPAGSR